MSLVVSGLADSIISTITISITYNSSFVKLNIHDIGGVPPVELREQAPGKFAAQLGLMAETPGCRAEQSWATHRVASWSFHIYEGAAG